jgi:hypothetical protein
VTTIDPRLHAYDLDAAAWRKSTKSNGNGGSNCIEVATFPVVVAVRDSKDPAGPALAFGPTQWKQFIAAVVAEEIR